MVHETHHMKSIWYFVGLILLSMGTVIFLMGIYYLFRPREMHTVLSQLHPDLWWGAFMILCGVVFFWLNRKAGE